ncbi:MAG: LolA family protein [Blastocatellia bacterium]
MKISLSVLIIIGLVAAAPGEASGRLGAAPAPQQLLTGILNKMEKAHLDLKSLRAELSQQKTNAQIGVSDNEYGSLIYKPSTGRNKGKLRIDYTRPSRDTIALVGDSVVYYQPRINQVFKSTLAKAAKGKVGGFTQLIGLDGSVKSLAGNYNIEFLKDEVINGQMTTLLRLTPKAGGQFSTIDIWVNQQSWIPAQWRLVERNGDFTIVSLKNVQLNTPIPDSAFNVSVPGGVKVVDKI